jgi:hypothetical protein
MAMRAMYLNESRRNSMQKGGWGGAPIPPV